MTAKTRKAPPRAMAMLESLRGLGYSTAAALADIVDNSISARASEVSIDFQWDGSNSRVLILDDGRGMSDPELEGAMRLGDKNPLATRETHDLGRFGMGLKTASLSQCRRLTVASAKGGEKSCLRWDLDELAADPQSDWVLFEGPAEGSERHLASLDGKASGTLVLWEKLDRIVTAGYTVDDYLALTVVVEAHLAMVFHRLLQGPRARIKLLLNGRAVEPWDPFMSGHPAKPWTSPPAPMRTDSGLVLCTSCRLNGSTSTLRTRSRLMLVVGVVNSNRSAASSMIWQSVPMISLIRLGESPSLSPRPFTLASVAR